MNRNMKRKALYGAILAAAGVALAPTSAQAAAYYYSNFELTNVNLFGEYQKVATYTDNDASGTYTAGDTVLTTTLVWARPGSNESAPRAASFTAKTSASNNLGASEANNDSRSFSSHVPPGGTFPLDVAHSEVGMADANGTFTKIGQVGQYSRADSLIDTVGINVNPFNVLQSAGETSKLVAEGRSTSSVVYASQATNTFTGYLDMTDLDFDDPAGSYDGTNLGWTGRLKLAFDYGYDFELATDPGDPLAEASRQVSLNIYEDVASGDIPSTNLVAAMNVLGDHCDLDNDNAHDDSCLGELNFNLSRSLGADFSETSVTGTSFEQIFNLSRGQIFFYELTFQHNVAGSATSVSVPEPGVLGLLGLGLLGLGLARRKQA